MKKIFSALGLLSDSTDSIYSIYPLTTDRGVVINGIKWATRNVDEPGAFAAKPESSGMFYQWDRKTAWSAIDPMISNVGGDVWDRSPINGDSWEKANDPAPAGWRIPTCAELRTLLNRDKVSSRWETKNGVLGRLFTDIATGATLFLPAAGYRSNGNGSLSNRSYGGYYWSSMAGNSNNAHYLYFNRGSQNTNYTNNYYGFSVRCVAAE